MPLDAARIELTVDAGGSQATLNTAEASMESIRAEQTRLTASSRENRQEQAALRTEIRSLNEVLRQNRADLAAVNTQLKETPTFHRRVRAELEAHRAAVLANTTEMRAERDTLRSRLGLYQAQGAAINAQLVPMRNAVAAQRALRTETQASTRTNSNANEAVFSLARGIEDAAFAQGNFAQIVRFSGNNVAQFVTQLGYMRSAAKAGGQTMTQALVASLTGTGGLLIGLSLLAVALPIITRLLGENEEAQKRAADAAREHTDEIEAQTDAIRRATGAEAARAIVESRRLATEAEARVTRLRAELQSVEQVAAAARQAARAGGGAEIGPEVQERLRLLDLVRAKETELNTAIVERNRLLGDATQAQERNRDNLATQLGLLQDQQRQLVETGQDATAVTRRIELLQERMKSLTGATERGATSAQLERRAEQAARLIAEVEAELIRTRREQEEAAIEETARRREAEARRLGISLTQIEEARLRARADLEERYAQEAASRAVEAAARQNILTARLDADNARDRAEAVFRAEEANFILQDQLADRALDAARVRFGEESAEYARLLADKERLAIEFASHGQDRLEAEEAAAEQLQRRLVQIAQDAFRARIVGETRLREAGARTDDERAEAARSRARAEFEADEAILQETLLRLRLSLAAEVQAGRERGVEAARIQGEIADGEQNLADLTASYREQVARAEADAYRQRLQEAEKFAARIERVLLDAFNFEQQFTDLDIELQAERFAEEERALRESLANREVSHREFDLEMRRLAQERSQFEQRVEADRAGFVARSWQGLTRLVIAEIQRQVAAWIAAQIVMGILTAGGSLLVPRNFATFAGGGYIGNRGESGRDRVPVVLGRGEAVLNRHQQRYVEQALLEKFGWGLDALFRQVSRPHYLASGGFAPDRPAMVAAARPAFATGGFVDVGTAGGQSLSRLMNQVEAVSQRQTRAIIEALGANANQVSGSVGDPAKARRLVQNARRREQATDPRRPR